MFQHRFITLSALSAFTATTLILLLVSSPAKAQLLTVVSDDFESYPTGEPNTPVGPYDFGFQSMISSEVVAGAGVDGTNALQLQFDIFDGEVLNTGVRWGLPAENNDTGNAANYTLSFDMAIASGVNTGFNSQFEVFDNQGGAVGFVVDMSGLTPGGGFQSFSFNLGESMYQPFGTEGFEPRVSTLDVQPFAIGFIASVDQMGQTMLYDNIRIEIAPPPVVPLTLVVNRDTGEVKILNDTASPVSFDYYALESFGAFLNPAGWNSLENQGFDASLAADFSGNDTVDGSDLAIWESSFGVNDEADANGDGFSDGFDFLIWQRQFGRVAGPADGWIEAGQSDVLRIGELYLTGAS